MNKISLLNETMSKKIQRKKSSKHSFEKIAITSLSVNCRIQSSSINKSTYPGYQTRPNMNSTIKIRRYEDENSNFSYNNGIVQKKKKTKTQKKQCQTQQSSTMKMKARQRNMKFRGC